MAPRLTRDELQWLHEIARNGISVVDTYELFVKRRKKARVAIPDLTTIRRALKQYARHCALCSAGHGEDAEEVVQN